MHLYFFHYVLTENLASHQPAWLSSTLRFSRVYYTADLAVDGQYAGRCALSYAGQTAEWRVDLGGVKNIHHVVIQHIGESILVIIYIRITCCYLK